MQVTLENYEQLRSEILEQNSNYTAIVLRENEKKLEEYLEKAKAQVLENFGESVFTIPPLFCENLRKTTLYKFCKAMPKGADLHVHDMALLPPLELIKLLKTCPEISINKDKKSYDLKFTCENGKAPKGYIGFCEALENGFYTESEILENFTILSAEKYGGGIWECFENLFSRHEILSYNTPFVLKYYEHTFRYYAKSNIMHIEIHIMLTESIDDSLDYLKKVREAYYKVKKDYPYFTVRIIGAGVKADNENIELTKKCFLNTSYVAEVLKDESNPKAHNNFVIGFDLVNEEDKSLPLKAFSKMLLKVKKQYPEMELFIHSGESLSASNENLIDAYLLGVKRVGHGLNLYRYPDLHSRFKKAEICLEVCPVSNMALGYTKDIRNHPATEYLKTGMPMALCSDDATYMEAETLTDDFFMAILGWDLKIAEIKQLCIYSIMYSGLDDEQKTTSLKAFGNLWQDFVDGMIME